MHISQRADLHGGEGGEYVSWNPLSAFSFAVGNNALMAGVVSFTLRSSLLMIVVEFYSCSNVEFYAVDIMLTWLVRLERARKVNHLHHVLSVERWTLNSA